MNKEVYHVDEEFDPFGNGNLVWGVRIVSDSFKIVQWEEDLMFWHINVFLDFKKDTPYALGGYHSLLMYRFKWMKNTKNNRVYMRHILERENHSGVIVGLSKIMLYKQDIMKGVVNEAHNLVKEMLTCIASDQGAKVKECFKC